MASSVEAAGCSVEWRAVDVSVLEVLEGVWGGLDARDENAVDVGWDIT